MVGCSNCDHLAAEMTTTRLIVERLEQTVLANITALAEARTLVESMQKTLLGNGQPGRCAEHGARIARLERWRSWMAGALAVIGVLWVAAVAIAAAVVERMKP